MIFMTAPAVQADWVRNGSAYLSGSDIVITPESGNQVGSAWLDSRIDLDYDFDITLRVYLGSSDGGADGLSIVFQNDPRGTAAVGDTTGGGEWIGTHTIYPALTVELDTYPNGVWNDPADDHIAINEFRDQDDGPGHAGALAVSLGDIEDATDHPLRLVWDSTARTLRISLDGAPVLTYTRDIAADIFDNVSQVWFGVVGSTGGAYNLQRFQPLITNDAMSVTKSASPSAVDAGETVTYTITAQNYGGIAASMSTIVDQLPAGFAYVAGTTAGLTNLDPSVGGQTLTWNGSWPLAPGQTRTISFQTIVAAAAGIYSNNAILRGTDFAELATGPTADVVVNGVPGPASGNKPLYLYSDPANRLSRTPPLSSQPAVRINGNNKSETWTLSPALASAFVISGDSGAIPVELYLDTQPNLFDTGYRLITVTLSSSSGILGTIGPQWHQLSLSGPAPVTFNIPVAGDINLQPGDTLQLTVSNTTGGGNYRLFVYPQSGGGNYSRVVLDAQTVINVDQVRLYDAGYPAGTPISSAAPGQSIFIRATVSDPFGSFDISKADLQIVDPTGAVVIDGAPMTEVFDAGGAAKIYEYTATVPAAGPQGDWTARVTAEEGTEGLVRHMGMATLRVVAPDILLLKTVFVVSDPINGGANPKAIPGALMQYAITATNQGHGAADGDSVVIIDPVPPDTSLFVGDLETPGSGPIGFSDGATPSGLTYTFGGLDSVTDDTGFSNDGGSTWTYTPVPDANGADAAVTHVRINPKGIFDGTTGGNTPSFTLRLRMLVR